MNVANHLYIWITALSVMTALSAYLTIRAEYNGPRRNLYIFKPLTMVCIIALASLVKYPISPFYRFTIIAGLVCSLVGDIFLMLPSDRFVAGLICFLFAHLFYIAAFTNGAYGEGHAGSIVAGGPLFLYGAIMLRMLWRVLGKMKAPVLVYILVIIVMAWAALGRYIVHRPGGALLAAVGAILFVASDSILALDKFKSRFRSSQLLILITYFSAQWLIALST